MTKLKKHPVAKLESAPSPFAPIVLASAKERALRDEVRKQRAALLLSNVHPFPETDPIVDQQTAVLKWKVANADECNDMEALPPISLTLIERHTMPGFPPTQSWLALAYAGYAVRIIRNPKRLTGPHEIHLHRLNPESPSSHPSLLFPPIATSFTEEFVYTKKERALEQYFRVLCEDIF